MEFINKYFYEIEKKLLYLMVLTIPIDTLPERYHLPDVFRNVHYTILLIAILIAIFYFIRNRYAFGAPKKFVKVYLLMCVIWPLFCTVLGVLNFPYWDHQAETFLQNTRMIQLIAAIYPDIIYNTDLLHLKYCISLILNTFHDIFIPLFGIPFVFYVMFGNRTWREVVDVISKAAKILAVALTLYSLVEISWLLTESDLFANILKFINGFLYDSTSNDWWPPLLWKNQLRSFTYEPSFFGIIAMFILPLLWYRAFQLHEKRTVVLLILFTWMVYLTKSRTAQVIFFSELCILVVLSVYGRYNSWITRIGSILIVTIFSFCIFLSAPGVLSFIRGGEATTNLSIDNVAVQYFKEDVSSIGIEKTRSNMARWGNMIATFKVGISHPMFGVGTGLQHMYIADNIPAFAQDDNEINFWIRRLRERGFMETGFPNLNSYSVVLACYGIPGLALYILPILYLMFIMYKNRRRISKDFGTICILIVFFGQLFCLFVNHFMYTYPIALATMLCLVQKMRIELSNEKL